MAIDYANINELPQRTREDTILGNIEGMPPMDIIPEDIKHRDNQWNRLFNKWFFGGVAGLQLKPKKEMTKEEHDKVIAYCMSMMVSFDPEHNHKCYAIAYILSLYYEKWTIK